MLIQFGLCLSVWKEATYTYRRRRKLGLISNRNTRELFFVFFYQNVCSLTNKQKLSLCFSVYSNGESIFFISYVISSVYLECVFEINAEV